MLKRANVIDLGDMQPLADGLRRISDVMDDVDRFEKEAEKHEAYRRNIVDNLVKVSQARGRRRDEEDDEYNAASDFLNLGTNNIAPQSLSDYMSGGFIGTQSEIDKALFPKKKKDTSIMEHINNLRRSTILQDLYDNDPILQEADPDDLANAYQSLVQSAPETSLNKEVVRAILRQSVNSMATSPFDAKQWADLDNVMLKNKSYYKQNVKDDRKDKDSK
jgi:hypothetical protein